MSKVAKCFAFAKKNGATYTLVQFLTFDCVTVSTGVSKCMHPWHIGNNILRGLGC